MKVRIGALLALFLIVLSGCGVEDLDDGFLVFSTTFDFRESEHGWDHGFSDYSADPANVSYYQFRYAYTDSLADVTSGNSILMSINNRDQGPFMYLKKLITGLRPDTEYTVAFNIEAGASDPTSSTASSGTYLKAGATSREPKPMLSANQYTINIDKGPLIGNGEDMILLGELNQAQNLAGTALVSHNNTAAKTPFIARTNGDGELWLIVGTQSNKQGRTTVFYSKITVVFSASQ